MTSSNTPKTFPKIKNGGVMWMCSWEYALEDTSWFFSIISSYDSTVDAIRIRTLFPLVPEGTKKKKKKIFFQNVHYWLFENRIVSAEFSQGASSIITTLLQSTRKISFAVSTFNFSVTSFSGDEFGLKIGTIFLKKHPILRLHKFDSMAVAFWHVLASVNANMRITF